MSELPNGWVFAALSEVCKQPDQRSPHANETFTYIDIASIDRNLKIVSAPQRLTGANASSRARKLVECGDVIVSMTRPNLNAVALIGEQYDGCIASTGFDVLRPIEVDPRWIFSAVKSAHFVDAMCKKVQGALYPAVKSADIRDYQIPLPPLAEQTRISAKLDELLPKVDTLKARIDGIPTLLQRFRQSVLTAAVSGKLSSSKITVRPVRLSEICISITDGDHQAPPRSSSGVPFITISAINDGVLRLEKATRYVPESYFHGLNSAKRAEVGDILFSVTGSICIPAMVLKAEPFTFQRHIAILKPDPHLVLQKYLFYCLASEDIRRQGENIATGTAQLTVPLKGLRNFSISLPLIEEQAEVVRCVELLFSFADQLEARVKAAQTLIDHLTQSILAKAFRGELVPQDQSDEPADVLLERIKAQRAAAPKAKRGRRATTLS